MYNRIIAVNLSLNQDLKWKIYASRITNDGEKKKAVLEKSNKKG